MDVCPVGILRSIGLFLNFCAIGFIRVLRKAVHVIRSGLRDGGVGSEGPTISCGDPSLYWTLFELLRHRH
jgi:hypothetical protein